MRPGQTSPGREDSGGPARPRNKCFPQLCGRGEGAVPTPPGGAALKPAPIGSGGTSHMLPAERERATFDVAMLMKLMGTDKRRKQLNRANKLFSEGEFAEGAEDTADYESYADQYTAQIARTAAASAPDCRKSSARSSSSRWPAPPPSISRNSPSRRASRRSARDGDGCEEELPPAPITSEGAVNFAAFVQCGGSISPD